jgi:hypothetical protein
VARNPCIFMLLVIESINISHKTLRPFWFLSILGEYTFSRLVGFLFGYV